MAFFKRQSKAANSPIDPSDPNTNSVFDAATEQRILEIGSLLLHQARSKKQSWLSTAFWSDKLMDWAMQDEAFKIQLFRFVDTFPMLVTPEQVHDHLMDYLTQPGVKLTSRSWHRFEGWRNDAKHNDKNCHKPNYKNG